MASETPQCKWTGKSGTVYTFWVYDILHIFEPNEDGNYIFARLENGAYHPVYIGQGCIADRCNGDHHRQACIESKGATHIHAHVKSKKEDREAEETDLLAAYQQAYVPTGCNVKIGG